MNIAYIMVSTVEQNESRQLEGLEKYNIDKIFQEKASAKDTNYILSNDNKFEYILYIWMLR